MWRKNRRKKENHLVQWREQQSRMMILERLAGTPRSRVSGTATRIWTLTQCKGCCGRIYRGKSDFCLRNPPVTVMAPETRVWLKAFLPQCQHPCCAGNVCSMGKHAWTEEELSTWKEEKAGHRAAEKSQKTPRRTPMAAWAVGALGFHISLSRVSQRNHGSELGDMRVIIISSRPIIYRWN